MKRRWLGMWAALAGMLLVVFQSGSAYACSAGPDFNAVAASELIVSGYITAQQPLTSTTPDDPQSAPTLHTIMVDKVYKGSVAPQVQFVGYPRTNSCGVAIPAGQYAIVGLSTGTDGAYGVSPLTIFFIGAEPAGDAYNAAVARLTPADASATSPATPTTPQTLPDTGVDAAMWEPVLVAGALALVVGATLAHALRRPASRQ